MKKLLKTLLNYILTILGRSRTPQLTIREIPTLGGGESFAYDVNDRGVVVGSALTAAGFNHAYRWDRGTIFDLGAFAGGNLSSAHAINGHGHVAGQSQLPGASALAHGFVSPPLQGISMHDDVGTLGGPNSVVWDFSIDHIAVGSADVPSGVHHAFVMTSGGALTDLTPALVGYSAAEAVDDAGNVAGWMSGGPGDVAFRWSPKTGLVPLVVPGGGVSRAFGLTYKGGLVVGQADFGNGNMHAAVWDAGNVAIDLGTLGGATSVAYDVNGSGLIVGSSSTSAGPRAFLAHAQPNTMVDLNGLIPPASGWILTEARAINAHGQIVGNGTLNGQPRGFLLT